MYTGTLVCLIVFLTDKTKQKNKCLLLISVICLPSPQNQKKNKKTSNTIIMIKKFKILFIRESLLSKKNVIMDCSRKLILSRNFPRGHSQKFIPKISRFFSLAKVPFTLFFKTLSANSTKVSVVTSLFSLLSKCFLTEARPSSFGYYDVDRQHQ